MCDIVYVWSVSPQLVRHQCCDIGGDVMGYGVWIFIQILQRLLIYVVMDRITTYNMDAF